jgi:hypothetical protein
MIGLMYLIAAVFYIGLMVVAVRFGWRMGGAKNGSRKRAAAYAFIGFLIVYLPLFWDHIPTLLLHRYYCAKDAGLTVYVSPEQWMKEHFDELDQARISSVQERVKTIQLPNGWRRSMANQKVAFETKNDSVGPSLIKINRSQVRLIDISTQHALATYVGYSAGQPFESGGLRLWMNMGSCSSSEVIGQLSVLHSKFELLGKTK